MLESRYRALGGTLEPVHASEGPTKDTFKIPYLLYKIIYHDSPLFLLYFVFSGMQIAFKIKLTLTHAQEWRKYNSHKEKKTPQILVLKHNHY